MDCQHGHSAQTVSIATNTMEKINSANQLTAKSNGFPNHAKTSTNQPHEM
jgi:hypothetical protein